MPDMQTPPIAEGLIEQLEDGIALLASRDRDSGKILFPPRPEDDPRYERILLPRRGRLWSWTVQRFRPKSPPYAGPEAFEPYAVGYVELDGALIVEGRIVGAAFDTLVIGMPMQLVPLPFEFGDGSARASFAFTPIEEAQA